MSAPDRTTREHEARDALERVARDTDALGTSAIARAGRRAADHLSAREVQGAEPGGDTDRIELWGRRIGRGLSLVGVVVLAWLLGVQLRFW